MGWMVSATSWLLFPPGKTRYPLCRTLGGPQGRSGWAWKILPPPGFDPWTVQPTAICYTDWAILAHERRWSFPNLRCCPFLEWLRKITLFVAKSIWEMISGPAIYKTAVLWIWCLCLVRCCRQLAIYPGHCTVFQYGGVQDYLHVARRYLILSRNVLLWYSNIHQFSQLPTICPFLVPVEFWISHSFEINSTLGLCHYNNYRGWHKSLDTRGIMFSIVCHVNSVPPCTLCFVNSCFYHHSKIVLGALVV
jgi:hypothetical protein